MEKYISPIVTVAGGLLALFVYVHLFTELAIVAQVVLYLVAVALSARLLLALGVMGLRGYGAMVAALEDTRRERLKTEETRIEVKVKEFQGSIIFNTADPGQQVYVTRLPGPAVTDPAHLAPGRINGVVPAWDGDGPTRWAMNHAAYGPRSIDPALMAPQVQPALMAPTLPEQVDLAPYIAGGSSLRAIFLGVGRWPSGEVKEVRAPLSGLVHVAMGGASGFGKSTLALALAYQVIEAREGPRPVMLDAAGVTFSVFRGDPRLLYPLADQEDEIEGTLEALTTEMGRRAALFRAYRGIARLEDYNALPGVERLPPIPIFFDEFSIVGDNKHIARFSRILAQQGRKAGLQLIAGCQTWLAQDIGSALRANMSTAIQFHVSKNQSRILLGSPDAASLTRPGQAYAVLPGQAGLVELQTPDPAGLMSGLAGEPVTIIDQETPQPTRANQEDADDLFVSLVEEGYSRSDASWKAYGKAYSGSHVTRCRRVLGEIGPSSS